MTTTNSNITAFESNGEEAEAAASSMDFLEKDDEMMVLPPSLENVTGSIPPILAAANITAANHHQEYRVSLNITEFRKDPMYSINFNWFRFIAIGVVPFLLLVYFNTQIYLGIVF